MEDPLILIEVPSVQLQTPLLQKQDEQGEKEEEEEEVDSLDRTLQRLETFLSFLGFNQSSIKSFLLSWTVFFLIGVLLPVFVLELSNCSGCEKEQISTFELGIVASQASLAAISLLFVSHNLRKYGIRKFLFVDKYNGQVLRLRDEYIQKISDSVRSLAFWILPCLIMKTAREVIRILYVNQEPWWVSLSVLCALIGSWTYVSTISVSACILFHLVCNLQVIHFDDYVKLLERESNVLLFIEEHIRLRHHLSKISHRFRIYLVLEFLVVTASQFMTLLQTTGYNGRITFINGGDFAVSSIVQVTGISLCLHAATKISHRAQGIASLASRWHALVTCTSDASNSQIRLSNSLQNLLGATTLNSLHLDYSESDLESLDYVARPTNTQLASYISSYNKRQSFVMYLQANPGGITIFGWTVDRALINTIFFIELSLVTFVLGKTMVFGSS